MSVHGILLKCFPRVFVDSVIPYLDVHLIINDAQYEKMLLVESAKICAKFDNKLPHMKRMNIQHENRDLVGFFSCIGCKTPTRDLFLQMCNECHKKIRTGRCPPAVVYCYTCYYPYTWAEVAGRPLVGLGQCSCSLGCRSVCNYCGNCCGNPGRYTLFIPRLNFSDWIRNKNDIIYCFRCYIMIKDCTGETLKWLIY